MATFFQNSNILKVAKKLQHFKSCQKLPKSCQTIYQDVALMLPHLTTKLPKSCIFGNKKRKMATFKLLPRGMICWAGRSNIRLLSLAEGLILASRSVDVG
jgi:hypothetical protein